MSINETVETLARADAAIKLRALADEIEAGTVSGATSSATLPDELLYKFDVEADEVEVKLEWAKQPAA